MQKRHPPATLAAPNHSLRRESSAISLAVFTRAGFAAALLIACHAEQKFPATSLSTSAPLELQLFQPTQATLDAQHSLTDLSQLNEQPAGAHGFVRPALAHFVDDRGTRLRFFGVNLSGIACLPEPEMATRLARHFRRLGFNAVRLHGLDGPGVLLDATGEISPTALALLDHFTAALKNEGIYFSFGLHAASGYPGLAGEAQTRFPRGNVLDRFHPPFIEAQRDFARRLLSHRNAETALEYRAEPALLYVELNHEDTIFPSRAGSPDDLPAEFRAELSQGYPAWIARRTAEGLRAPGPAEEEAKAALPTFGAAPGARADYAEYLRELERNSVRSLIAFIREELGLRSMLINSQASFGGLAGVLREAEMSDFIDVHGRWDGPQFSASDAGSLGKLASYRVFGKPFVVSDYAAAAPSDHAAEMFPLMTGIAGLQDWDAIFAFAYADQKREYEPARISGAFDIAGHPAKLAFISSAALAFRRGLVAPGRSRIELSVPEQPSALPFTEDALPDAWGAQRVPASTVALRQLGISLRAGYGEISAGYAPRVSGVLGSDTGEILWEPRGPHARFSIDAPALKAVCGLLSHTELPFAGVSFEFPAFTPGFACATLVSLDDAPIASARRLLFTVSGLAQNAAAPAPALAQYVPVSVTLPRDTWRAEALDAAGKPLRTLPVLNERGSKISTTYAGAALSYAFTR